MDRRYRRRIKKLLICAAVAVPLLVAGGAVAEPSDLHVQTAPIRWSNPAVNAPGGAGITPQVTQLSLGAFDAPAAGVTVQNGAPPGVPLVEKNIPKGTKPRTLTIVRASTARFSAVGVTWRESDQIGAVSVAVRGHTPGADWSTWQAVGVADSDKDAPAPPKNPKKQKDPPPTTRGGADLVWLGSSDGIELSVTWINGRAPHDITADLIDPTDAPSDANPLPAPPPKAESAGRVPRPQIYSRAAWGADERVMTWRPQYAPVVKAIVFHHTATSNAYTQADVPKIMRAIYQYQTISRGWGDVGYNVLVDRFGRLWEGRSGGLSRPVVGAQAGGFNTGTAGIAVIGNFTGTPVPQPAAEATARYAAWKLSLGPAVDPRGTVTLTGGGSTSRYSPGTTLTVPRIFPHRQTHATECPGSIGLAALPPIRVRAAVLLGDLMDPATIRPRLAVWHPASASYLVLGQSAPLLAGAPGDVPAPADYDGDGITDAAVWTPSTGVWKIQNSADGSVQTQQWGSPGDRPVPADYTGDGQAELAVFHPATGGWSIQGIGDLSYGQPGDVPVPADYTGDGAADLAVWRPKTGTWLMGGAGEFRLGEAWHIPVPADYNGDGTADPASWSPVSQRFFVRGMGPVALGKRGDIPAPALYDGDLKADFAVYHRLGDGRAEYQIRGRDPIVVGAAGDLPMPLR
jgi:hypothetical protein